jgi:hypothetical protein
MWLMISALIGVAFSGLAPAVANKLDGPARFCGYSPIIDLLPGERVTTLQGGIHAGSFRWDGSFGSLVVHGIGWASRPKGRMVNRLSNRHPARFKQRWMEGEYQIAIWNGAQAVAYFRSSAPFTRRQIEAIDRVMLFQEGQDPLGCKLRTIFSWDF